MSTLSNYAAHTGDDDQRTMPQSEIPTAPRFEEGQPNAHQGLDSKDQRSLKNRLDAATTQNTDSNESERTITDPLAPAKEHGNEPSRGAKIDAELQAEDEGLLKNKGMA